MTKYNICCINDGCDSKTIQGTKKNTKCPKCGKKMKVLGIATYLIHTGKQDGTI